jgi:hypothetical protein
MPPPHRPSLGLEARPAALARLAHEAVATLHREVASQVAISARATIRTYTSISHHTHLSPSLRLHTGHAPQPWALPTTPSRPLIATWICCARVARCGAGA